MYMNQNLADNETFVSHVTCVRRGNNLALGLFISSEYAVFLNKTESKKFVAFCIDLM